MHRKKLVVLAVLVAALFAAEGLRTVPGFVLNQPAIAGSNWRKFGRESS